MICEFSDGSTRPQNFSSGNVDLERLQYSAITKEELADEVWYVPLPYAFLNQSLEGKSGKVLVVGCGTGRDAESFQLESDDDDPMPQVVGIDINRRAIEIAQSNVVVKGSTGWGPEGTWSVADPTYLVADITQEETIENLLRVNEGPFDVATFVGVLGNLITPETVLRALQNTARVLKAKGKVVISDFGWWQAKVSSDHYWERRYDRDQAALLLCGEQEDCLGTVVIHPFGLSDSESLSLSPEQVAEAIQKKKFERLVRHWRVSQIKDFLQKGGFAVLKEKERVRCWNPEKLLDSVIDGSELEERKFLLNYQILAQMTG